MLETSELCTPLHSAVLGMSFGVSVGIRTLSMTWITPLLVPTSARVTFASFTITPEPRLKDRICPFTAGAVIQSDSAVDGTFPDTTW